MGRLSLAAARGAPSSSGSVAGASGACEWVGDRAVSGAPAAHLSAAWGASDLRLSRPELLRRSATTRAELLPRATTGADRCYRRLSGAVVVVVGAR